MHSVREKLLELGNDGVNEGASESNCAQSIESTINYSMLGSFKAKKYGKRGQLFLGLQVIVLLMQTIYEVWLLGVNAIHLALRLSAAVFLILSICKYEVSFRQVGWRIVLLLIQFMVILVINA